MKLTLYYSLPLFGNQFKGEVYNLTQLSAKFQIWCRQFNVDSIESLALWTAGERGTDYFDTEEECLIIAREAYNALPKQSGFIDLTEIG